MPAPIKTSLPSPLSRLQAILGAPHQNLKNQKFILLSLAMVEQLLSAQLVRFALEGSIRRLAASGFDSAMAGFPAEV
jgi:hypothetical protein